jgi:hypothetical protein
MQRLATDKMLKDFSKERKNAHMQGEQKVPETTPTFHSFSPIGLFSLPTICGRQPVESEKHLQTSPVRSSHDLEATMGTIVWSNFPPWPNPNVCGTKEIRIASQSDHFLFWAMIHPIACCHRGGKEYASSMSNEGQEWKEQEGVWRQNGAKNIPHKRWHTGNFSDSYLPHHPA